MVLHSNFTTVKKLFQLFTWYDNNYLMMNTFAQMVIIYAYCRGRKQSNNPRIILHLCLKEKYEHCRGEGKQETHIPHDCRFVFNNFDTWYNIYLIVISLCILDDRFKVGRNIDIRMEIKPRNTSGLLMAVHAKRDYLVLQINEGSINLTVENGNGPISTIFSPSTTDYFCDGQWHSIIGEQYQPMPNAQINFEIIIDEC